ncbi:hypothetical protein [Natronomonas marina]|jgi:hypothetical protein|nr:hypothetical protein [Natronomonas marina]
MLVDVFGPFLIPAVLFLLGVLGYGLVLLLSRLRGDEDYRAP